MHLVRYTYTHFVSSVNTFSFFLSDDEVHEVLLIIIIEIHTRRDYCSSYDLNNTTLINAAVIVRRLYELLIIM